MSPGHIEVETLAAFAEGHLGEAESLEIRRHLLGCRTCTAIWVDAIRYRAAWLANSEAFEMDHADRATAHDLAGSRKARPSRSPIWPRAVALAGLAVLLAVVGRLAVLRSSESPDDRIHLHPAVLKAFSISQGLELVLPGTEGLRPRGEARRSGSPSVSVDLDRQLKESLADYERKPGDPRAGVRLVATLLAAGDVESAAPYASECLRAHPDDAAMLLWAAEIAMREDRLADAQRLVERAVAIGDTRATLDLGIVRRERGDVAGAAASFERASRSTDAAIAARARAERDRLAR